MLNIITQSSSLIGLRDKNEDEIDIINNINNTDKTLKPILYSAVFDGHGGGDISKMIKNKYTISNYIISSDAKTIKNTNEYNDYISKVFKLLQKKLINDEIKANKMGSTCLINVIYKKNDNSDYYLKVINLGDCRSVICNKYLIGVPLSKDHKPSRWDEEKRIKNEGGTIEYEIGDDPRISGLSVSRCFGDLDCKYISQTPEIFDYKLDKDKFLILACDGLWDVISNQDAVDFVIKKLLELKNIKNLLDKTHKTKTNNIAYLLANYAIEKGSEDNLSINIIFFCDYLNIIEL